MVAPELTQFNRKESPMELEASYPVVVTDKLIECRDFYTRWFGFRVVFEATWFVYLGAGQGTVDVATSVLGQIVDSQGRTSYLFAKDTWTQSECTGACASAWPPPKRPARRRSVAGQTPRSWEPPCARTVAHRSPTRAPALPVLG